jgi:NAD(P)-dependent dehydrogenase (short-subunit alcohol dehydrogenase family)
MTQRVVIVTGNGSGIGYAIHERLVDDGFHVVGTHRDGCRDWNVTNYADLEDLVRVATGRGELYGLVNNAGVLDEDEFHFTSKEDFNRVMHTNVLAPIWMAELAVEHGARNIVNVSGLYGKTGAFGRKPVYAASKAALNNVTLTLARMLAPTVRVNAVLPGIIPTGIHDDPDRHPPHGHALLQRTGTPEDVAEAVAWLMSDKSSYVTGQLLEVCGGR